MLQFCIKISILETAWEYLETYLITIGVRVLQNVALHVTTVLLMRESCKTAQEQSITFKSCLMPISLSWLNICLLVLLSSHLHRISERSGEYQRRGVQDQIHETGAESWPE